MTRDRVQALSGDTSPRLERVVLWLAKHTPTFIFGRLYLRLVRRRGIEVRSPTDAELHNIQLELEVLDLIEQVQDSGKHEGKCPNWMIPGRIPVQRLQGLKRRGLLDYSAGQWWLTELGIARQRALRGFGGRA